MAQEPVQEQEPGSFRVRLSWRVAEEHPIEFVNELLVQIFRDEFIITVGQFTPPGLISPSKEEIEALPETMSPLVIARFAVSPNRLRSFIHLLQRQLEVYESREYQSTLDTTSTEEFENT